MAKAETLSAASENATPAPRCKRFGIRFIEAYTPGYAADYPADYDGAAIGAYPREHSRCGPAPLERMLKRCLRAAGLAASVAAGALSCAGHPSPALPPAALPAPA